MTKEEKKLVEAYQAKYGTDKHPAFTVDAVVICPSFDERDNGTYQQNDVFSFRVLLIRKGQWPEEGKWALPGGFVRKGEICSKAAERELREETGLDLQLMMPIGVFDDPGRDIRGWIVSQAYLKVMRPRDGVEVKGGSDAAEAQWFRVVNPEVKNGRMMLPLHNNKGKVFTIEAKYKDGDFGTSNVTEVLKGGLAFDHDKIIATAVLRLFSCDPMKLVSYFLPENFTIPQFVEVYQYLARKELTYAELPNFRRQLTKKKNPMLVSTGKREKLHSGVGHPPAMLYRFNC